MTCHCQDKGTDIEKYYEKYAATHPQQILHAKVKVGHWYDQVMLERNRWLESEIIMLIRTFHHADVVWLRQGNQYIYVIMYPKSFVSPRSAILPGEAYCHYERWRIDLKKLTYWSQNISCQNNPFNHMMLNMKHCENGKEFVNPLKR